MFIRLTENDSGGGKAVLLPIGNITGIAENVDSRLVYLKEEYDGKKCVSVYESLSFIESHLNRLLKE